MKTRYSEVRLARFLVLLATISLCQLMIIPVRADDGNAVGPKLTPKLKSLLVQEMQLVLQASSKIHTAIITGDHQTAANQATKIHDSFIMRRSLTEQDKKDLKNAVPAAFLALDARLHQTAAKLARAAEQKDVELEAVFFAKMTDACIACHSAYAGDRFPSLSMTSGSHR